MIKLYLWPTLVFLIGVYTLVAGKKNPLQSLHLSLLSLSLIIAIEKGIIFSLLFFALFIPLIFFSHKHFEKVKRPRHSTVKEKSSVYIGLLPGFGLYFLFRKDLESAMKSISISSEILRSTEVAVIIILFIFFSLSMRRIKQ